MQPIQPTGADSGVPLQSRQSASAGAVRQGATTNTVSTTSSTSSTNVTIQQQVEVFLNSIDPAMANNQYLKLLIAALIMQFLLGDESSMQQTGQAGLNALEGLTGSRTNSMYLSIESATNTAQTQQQSTRLDVVGAVQTLSDTAETGEKAGGQIDVSG